MSEPAAGQAERVKSESTNKFGEIPGPAERVHPGSPETKPAEAGSQRLGGFRVPHADGKPVETPQNVLPPTGPGSNV